MKRTIALCCVTALAIAGLVPAYGAVTHLITGKNVKNHSLTGVDIKRGSLGMSTFSKSVRAKINSRTVGGGTTPAAPGEHGVNGENGAPGQNGLNGRDGANPGVQVLNVGDQGWDQSATDPGNADAQIENGELYFQGDAKQGLKKSYTTQNVCSDLTALSYKFRVDNRGPSSSIAPAVKLEVDSNGAAAGGFTTLIFEPVYQPGRSGSDPDTTREGMVSAYAPGNRWWSSHAIGGMPDTSTYHSIQQICADNPDMGDGFNLLLESGSGSGADYAAAADDLLVGFGSSFTRYDFGG